MEKGELFCGFWFAGGVGANRKCAFPGRVDTQNARFFPNSVRFCPLFENHVLSMPDS